MPRLYEPQYINSNNVRDYVDLDLSMIAHPISGDIPVVTGVEAIKRSIKNLVLLEHYEKPFHPDIGCDVYKTLFENIELPGTEEQLRESIENTIEQYEPRADLQKIDIEARPDDNGINVAIWFTPENSIEPVSVELFLKILR